VSTLNCAAANSNDEGPTRKGEGGGMKEEGRGTMDEGSWMKKKNYSIIFRLVM